MTPSIKIPVTLSLKNTIPTLALLVAIFMLSGCVGQALNRLATKFENQAKEGLEKAGEDLEDQINDIKGIDDFAANDPCITNLNNLFNNPTDCDDEYDLAREQRCADANTYDVALCGATVTRVCDNNINKELCIDKPGYGIRRAQGLTIVDVSDWTNSFTTDDGAATVVELGTTATHTIDENLFLADLTLAELKKYQITNDFKDGFNVNDGDATKRRDEQIFTIADADTGTRGQNRSIGTLTLAHKQLINPSPPSPIFHGFKEPGATAEDDASTGDVNDGVSFVAGQFNRRFGECLGGECAIHRYYAGVHATTDLGAPLTAAPASGTWKGLLRTVGLGNLTSVPFDINITFNRANKGGTIKANFDALGSYDIDATYDSFGAITGNVTLLDSPGKVSGIIGQEGLVAAFISDFTGVQSNRGDSPAGYAGGFVAYLPNPIPPEPCITNRECPDYTHWVTAADPTTTTTANRFLTGTAGGLTTGRSFVGQSTTLASSNLARGLRAEEATDGFAIFYSGSVHNVGLLSTTRFPAPWRNNLTNGQWEGQFVSRVGEENRTRLTNFTLTVAFSGTSGTVSATDVGHLGAFSFTADYDNYGVMSNGVITRTVTTPTADTSTGVVTGLVGTGIGGFGAAVGVFHSNAGADTSYVGGFVASGEAERTTQ